MVQMLVWTWWFYDELVFMEYISIREILLFSEYTFLYTGYISNAVV